MTTASPLRTTTFSDVPPEILQSHILNRLDGRSLAAVSCASSLLRRLSSRPHLWSHLCRSTWPSVSLSPRLRHLITSTSPGGAGPRSFFSDCSLLPASGGPPQPPPLTELISAVDIRLGGSLIFSRARETDAKSGWFQCSPFRIDMLDPKESVPTLVRDDDGACDSIAVGMQLSWIVADPARRRAADLSSGRALWVRRHWLSGEVEARFAAVLRGEERGTRVYVEFGMVVTLSAAEEGGGGMMHVREVSMRAEDMEGKDVKGREGVVILARALEGERGRSGREEVGRRRYEEYLERKREWRERKATSERRLDEVCLATGAFLLAALCCYLLCFSLRLAVGTVNGCFSLPNFVYSIV